MPLGVTDPVAWTLGVPDSVPLGVRDPVALTLGVPDPATSTLGAPVSVSLTRGAPVSVPLEVRDPVALTLGVPDSAARSGDVVVFLEPFSRLRADGPASLSVGVPHLESEFPSSEQLSG